MKENLKKTGFSLLKSSTSKFIFSFYLFFSALNNNFAFAVDTDSDRAFILSEISKNAFGFYAARSGDTIAKIAKKYNGNADIILAANSSISSVDSSIVKGKQIKIPVSELRNTLKRETMLLNKTREPEISYSSSSNTIIISGKGSVATFADIHNAVSDAILEKNGKEWILRANILAKEDTGLIIDGNDVTWLKLLSQEGKFVTIKSEYGNILIKNTKITSWDEENDTVDKNHEDGRAFILIRYNGRMDIENSEIGYLGNKLIAEIGGGSYGLSWRIPKDSYKKNLVTGNVKSSKIHHNYFGIYTFGATGMKITNNEVYENVQYGIDPHDDTNNLSIRENVVHNNGNHGIIASKRCFYNVAKFNITFDNALHGMMLDKDSNFNIFEYNTVYDNVDGIALSGSHYNIIRNNEIRSGKSGVRLSSESSKNYIEKNIITESTNGIFIYSNSNSNYALNNRIFGNLIGIYLKDTTNNVLRNNLIKGENSTDLKLGPNSSGNIIEENI